MDPPVPGARFGGAAVIFTPCNEMRIVENDQLAKDGSGKYLSPSRRGYNDVSGTEYLTLPVGSAVAGISRNSAASANFLAPPFAIRFDETGQMISGVDHTGDRCVCYPNAFDAQGNPTQYPVSITRPNTYNPDGSDNVYASPPLVKTQGRYPLPFYTLETVIGVVVYDKTDFHSRGGNWGTGAAPKGYASIANYLTSVGKTYLVNRNTGTLLKP
jgi:hypothetical protein